MQLELFTPTSFYFTMTMTADQRAELCKAGFGLYNQMRLTRHEVRGQVARAMYFAQMQGYKFSQYPRR